MRVLRITILLLATAFALGACGSDDSGSGSSGSTASTTSTSSTTTAAKSSVPEPPTTPPASIQVTDAVGKPVPTGKTAIFLQCELPSCGRYAPAFQSAAKSLGWTGKIMAMKNSAPAAALEQAVAQKPDYIALSGIPAAALKVALEKAHAANIPVISAAVPEKPSADGWAAQIGGTLVPDAENIGKWIANDSGGKANVVAVTIPQFPVLGGETDWFKNDFTKLCSGCSYDELAVTIEDVGGGAVPQKLTGYLQAHPDVDYVFFTFSDLGKGIGPALQRAGLRDKIKLTGCCGDSALAQEILKGDSDAWTIAPNEYSAYAMVDAMARLAAGDTLSSSYEDKVYGSPSWVVDSADAVNQYLKPTKFDWLGPTGFEAQFTKLWGAS
jgi:ribose transport system substrate-binding protein